MFFDRILFIFICSATVLSLKSETLKSETLKPEALKSEGQGACASGLGKMPSFENMLGDGELEIGPMQDFYQEMIKIWVEAKKREEERKILYLSKLTEEHRALLQKTQNQFSDFLETIDIRNGLARMCKEVRNELDLLVKEASGTKKISENLQEIYKKLEKLQTAIELDCCCFLPKRMPGMSSKGIEDMSGVMGGLMKSLLPVPGEDNEVSELTGADSEEDAQDPALIFSMEDVLAFCDVLSKLLKSDLLKEDAENKVGLFWDILTAISHQKPQELTLCYVKYIEPEFDNAYKVLKDARKLFEEKVKLYLEDTRVTDTSVADTSVADTSVADTKRAYIFWLKEIKKNQRTLMAFSTLKNGATSSFANTEKLFEVMAYTYDIANCFYSFYKKDMKFKHMQLGGEGLIKYAFSKDVLIPEITDWAFRSGFAIWSFMVKRPTVTTGLLYNSVMGNMPLNMIDLKQTTVFNLMVMPFAVMAFFQPSHENWQMPDLVKSFGKIAGAWFYYHIFYCNLFGAEEGDPLWPANNVHLKNSIYRCLLDVEYEISKKFSHIVRSHTDPFLVEKIQTYSLDIVKPEDMGDSCSQKSHNLAAFFLKNIQDKLEETVLEIHLVES